jgi:hypothetical protein
MSISGNPHEEYARMMFNTNLGTAKNQSDLEELLHEYAPPAYDPLYVCLATRDDFKKERQWIEAIAVEKGGAPNRVPEMVFNDVADLLEDQMLLRLLSGVADKYKRYRIEIKRNFTFTVQDFAKSCGAPIQQGNAELFGKDILNADRIYRHRRHGSAHDA